MPISLIAIAESCAGSWTPVCAISTIVLAIISVIGSSRSTRPMMRNVFNDAQRLLVGRFEAPDKLRLQRRTLQSSEQDLTGTPIGSDLFFFSVELRVHLPGRNRTDKMGV
jgi:hypothetical protein